MSRQIFEVNPVTKMKTWFDHDEQTGKSYLYHEQDLEPLLRWTKAHANEGAKDHGIKGGRWHYAELPAVVIYEMRKKGIDVFNPDHLKAMLIEINTNYPYLKMTGKKHVSNV